MKQKNLFLRFSASTIDLSIIITIAIIITNFIPLNQYVGTMQIFLITSFFYFLISYYFKCYSFGKYLLQIKLFTIEDSKPAFSTLLKRELFFKFLIIIVPAYLLNLLVAESQTNISLYIDFNVSILIVSILFFTISLIKWLFTNKTWWDSLSKTKVEKISESKNKIIFSYIFLFLFFLASFFAIKFLNNRNQNHDISFLGFKYPVNFKSHALDANAKAYVEFLKNQQLSSKDYIFKLFEKYDIVVLCETNHRETTQWDFISDLVNDERFINNIGNIFTEYGATSKQKQIDLLLNTKYDNRDSLMKNVSKLMHFKNLGFFNFICDLNTLNTKLSDSLKIKEYFTDIDGIEDYLYYYNPEELIRDSLMADVIINKFTEIQKNENRKKCLIVTNQRHAFGPIKENGKLKNPYHETQFIFRAFPEKTANVLINH